MAYPYTAYSPYMPAFNPQAPVYPPVQQNAPQSAQQGLSAASRAVSSKEEAIGVAADFSGAVMVFPDVAHNRVYVKRWNYQTGAADFFEYVPAGEEKPVVQYATIDDLNALREEFMKMRKAGKKNDADE